LPPKSNRPARKRRRRVSFNRFATMHSTQHLPSIGLTHEGVGGSHESRKYKQCLLMPG
jgi:hypothetical protein